MVKQCQYKDKENRQCPQATMQTAFPEGSDYCAWHDPSELERAKASTHHLVNKVLHRIVQCVVQGRADGRDLYDDIPDPTSEVVLSYVMGGIDSQSDEYNLIRESLEKCPATFTDIHFTKLNDACMSDLFNIFNNVRSASFLGCEFDSFFKREQRSDLLFMSIAPKVSAP